MALACEGVANIGNSQGTNDLDKAIEVMWKWGVDGCLIVKQSDSFEQIAGQTGLMAGKKNMS